MDSYYNSVGRNRELFCLISRLCPTVSFTENDEKAALDLAASVKESFAVNLAANTKTEATNVRGDSRKFGANNAIDTDKNTFWATDDDVTTAASLTMISRPTRFNRFMAQEYIRLGQRVKAFTVEAFVNGQWEEIAKATTIGYKRILRFPTVEATQVRFNVAA